MSLVITAGIDVGAATTKAAIVGANRHVLARAMTRTGASPGEAAQHVYDAVLRQAGMHAGEIDYVVSTGFGRYMVAFRNTQVTDFTAHAQGALHHFPETRCILDIGAQSTRASRIEPTGQVAAFRMNSRCAAGAGAFMVRVSHFLEIPLEDLGTLSQRSREPKSISSVCAVLAETEIINHITAGVKEEDIVRGVLTAVANQGLVLLRRVGITPRITLTGGASKNAGMVEILRELADQDVNVDATDEEGSFYAGALGAGILAHMRLEKLAA